MRNTSADWLSIAKICLPSDFKLPQICQQPGITCGSTVYMYIVDNAPVNHFKEQKKLMIKRSVQ
jgi:hypothetical protein